MWLLSAIPWMTMLLSCSGERARAKAEEPRGTDQTGSAAIEFAPPSPETIPGSQLGEQIRLGYQIIVNTQEYARPYVGNRLNCTNGHLDSRLNPNAASFVVLAAVYPEYRARNARVNTLADRINECVERSLNGERSLLTVPSCRPSWPISPGSRAEYRAVRRYPGCHGAAGLGTAVLHDCRRHGTGDCRRRLHQIEHAA
jgi:hypothetical protein